ncbi:MAG: anthranilate phosphoribosyltransferase [Candidatus Bathyarchaeota archaeon]|nr:anthranilate phosphoribosyltransferase [Candidatus Bathyarchaeota archaeon]
MIREGIQKIIEGNNLTYEESAQIMNEIMTGKATNAQTAAFLTALRMKGETPEELIAFASVMRKNCQQIQPHVQGRLVDTCGTGGDKLKTFNVSTAAAFVIAGAGISVAKHGNRAVTSKSGSADVLEKLGLNLNLEPKAVERIIERVGVGFMFAPAFHPAMKYVAEARREIGIRTVFNMLGPLTNPACANTQLLGVYDPKMAVSMACALAKLGCEEAMIVHGFDGLDEISTVGKTLIVHVKDGNIIKKETHPRDFGIRKATATDLQLSASDESAETLFRILCGNITNEAKAEIVLVNSAAGIIIGGKAHNYLEAMECAKESIESGLALAKLKALVKASDGNLQKLEELEAKYE